jgi:hypothetical protein
VVEPASKQKPAVYFTRANLEEMFELDGCASPSRLDVPKAWLTMDDPRFEDGLWSRPVGPPVNEIKTVDEMVDVKNWLSSAEDAAKARRAAVAEADEYVLVDGNLHRRTAAPMLAWFSFRPIRDPEADDGEMPMLVDAAEFVELTADKDAEGAWWNWWLVSASSGSIGMAHGSDWKIEVEAPLETDRVADPIRVARTVIPRIDHYLSDAVEHLIAVSTTSVPTAPTVPADLLDSATSTHSSQRWRRRAIWLKTLVSVQANARSNSVPLSSRGICSLGRAIA